MVDHYKLFADQIIAKEVYNESDDTVYTIVPCSSGMDACPGTDGYYAMIWHNASVFSSKFFKLSVVKKEEIADYCTADRMCDEIITDTKSLIKLISNLNAGTMTQCLVHLSLPSEHNGYFNGAFRQEYDIIVAITPVK